VVPSKSATCGAVRDPSSNSLRRLNDRAEQYTWWSNRGQAWAKNVGWRLDYHLATPGIAHLARKEAIYKEQWFSDHAPITATFAAKLPRTDA